MQNVSAANCNVIFLSVKTYPPQPVLALSKAKNAILLLPILMSARKNVNRLILCRNFIFAAHELFVRQCAGRAPYANRPVSAARYAKNIAAAAQERFFVL